MNEFLDLGDISIRVSAITAIRWHCDECVQIVMGNNTFELLYGRNSAEIKQLCSIFKKDFNYLENKSMKSFFERKESFVQSEVVRLKTESDSISKKYIQQKLSTNQIDDLITNDIELKTFKFTEEECLFLIAVVNGVKCTPETLIANVSAESEFIPIPSDLGRKLEILNADDIRNLHNRLYRFWDTECHHINSTIDRLKEVGLL